MSRYKFLIVYLLFACGSLILLASCEKKETDEKDDPFEVNYLSLWTEGYLDIHAINTGKAECTFLILPDGTTMLIDAGAALTPPPESVPKPNDSRTPGQWISRYISNVLKDFDIVKLNYMVLSHFHWDHMGGITDDMQLSGSGAYKLSGVTEVAEEINMDMIIDRDWPDYNWPFDIDDDKMNNYKDFVNWQSSNNNVDVEHFEPGVNNQLVLVNDPDNYPNFEIRNISVNGNVWTGSGSSVENHFPSSEDFDQTGFPPENACSISFRVSYGNFDYFTGGDISFRGSESGDEEDQWKNIEAPISAVTGTVEVLKANHHGNWDANSDNFLRSLQPRVIVIHTWLENQPAFTCMQRMTSDNNFTTLPDIFATNILPAKQTELGSDFYKMKSTQGHVVIRVEPGGVRYWVYVLDDTSETFLIKEVHGPYQSS